MKRSSQAPLFRNYCPVIFVYTLFIAAVMPAVGAADQISARDQWKKYLTTAECSALTQIKTSQATEQPDNGDGKLPDFAAILPMARNDFERNAIDMAPPMPTVKVAAYDENGILGLWFKPENADSKRVLLYFHGGGYAIGSTKATAMITGFLAEHAGVTCFSLDYPLAPEHPFPAALDNAVAAYRMLLEEGFILENIFLAGDSAGGGFCLALMVNLRAE